MAQTSLSIFTVLHVAVTAHSILMWSDQADSSLNPTQKMEVLQKKVEMLGGTARGNWALDCETLQSTPSLGRLISADRI